MSFQQKLPLQFNYGGILSYHEMDLNAPCAPFPLPTQLAHFSKSSRQSITPHSTQLPGCLTSNLQHFFSIIMFSPTISGYLPTWTETQISFLFTNRQVSILEKILST